MQSNQHLFEVVRDLTTMIDKLLPGESFQISIQRNAGDNKDLFDWGSSNGTVCGSSSVANRMENAYRGHANERKEESIETSTIDSRLTKLLEHHQFMTRHPESMQMVSRDALIEQLKGVLSGDLYS